MARRLTIPATEAPARRWFEPIRNAALRGLDTVRGYFGGTMLSSEATVAAWLSGQPPAAAGVIVSHATALMIASVHNAVSLISQDVSSLPCNVYKRLPSGGGARFPGHPLNKLLSECANPEMTAFEFKAALLVNMLLSGGGFAEITRDQIGRPAQLWLVTSDRVVPQRDRTGQLEYRVRQSGGPDVITPASNMIHIKGLSPDGVIGYDTVQLARETLGLALAAERSGAKFFSQGAQIGGVLSTPALSEQAQINLRKSIESRHAGADNAGKLLLVPPGSTFTGTTVTPRDGQVLELRLYLVREVARFFKLPVSMLGDLERSTFSNHSEEKLSYFTSCLRPLLVRVEQELNMKLLSESERQALRIEFNVNGFLRSDSESRGNFYQQMLMSGAMSVNEVRALENLPPVPGGDVPRVPMNTEPVSQQQPTGGA
jgi:HK97 family phage portal protein